MKASLFLVASGAMLAMAGPVLHKRAMETEVVTELFYVTVTEDEPAPTAAFFRGGQQGHQFKERPAASPTTSSVFVPPPAEPTVEIPAPVIPEPTPEPVVTPPPVVPAPVEPKPEPVAPAPVVPAPVVDEKVEAPPTTGSLADVATYHHNVHRLNHSAPALSWSDTLASYAAKTAATCVFEHDTATGGGGYGQNLAMAGESNDKATASTRLADSITMMWYNGELRKYPGYGDADPSMDSFGGWGHFSQVVWKNTKEVGCAVQYCKAGTMVPNMAVWYTVCDYAPAGNVQTLYGKNVLPPLGKATINT